VLAYPSDFTVRLLPRLQGRSLPVHSLFARSVNLLASPTVLLTITDPSLGRSPFGLAAEGDVAAIIPAIREAGALTCRPGGIWAAGRKLLTVETGAPYSTDLAVVQQRPIVDARSFHQLLLTLSDGARGGLTDLLFTWPWCQPLSQSAAPAWVERARASAAVFARAAAPDLVGAAARLLGLGIGLTPSGDDFLVGFSAERLAQGCHHEVKLLAGALSHRVFRATSLVSASYLRHAFRGRFGSQVRRLVHVLHNPAATPEELRAAVQQVVSVGSTSGWDSVIGMLAALYRYQNETDPASPL